jgi:alpha-tubulin suppressor-like RCC1 family protein
MKRKLILTRLNLARPAVAGLGAILLSSLVCVTRAYESDIVAWGSLLTLDGLDGPVKDMAGGDGFVVALKEDSTVMAWGSNYEGQATVPPGLTGVTAISVGVHHTVALKSDGTVVAWGGNDHGQTIVPVGLGGIKAVSAGESHTLVLKDDGTVVAWGNDSSGQTSVPPGLTGVKAISAGLVASVAIMPDGSVVSWGDITPQPDLKGVKQVSWFGCCAGYGSRIVYLLEDGTVLQDGRMGFSKRRISCGLVNIRVVNVTGVRQIASLKNGLESAALLEDGTVVAWGNYGESTNPTGLTHVKSIRGGYNFELAFEEDGTVHPFTRWTPGARLTREGLVGVKTVAMTQTHILALKADGTVVEWPPEYSSAFQVPAGLTGVKAIACGDYHSVAVKEDGTVVQWGDTSGHWDDTPVPAGLTGVKSVAVVGDGLGNDNTVALKTDGTVVAWGDTLSGRVNVPRAMTGVKTIAAGGGSWPGMIAGNIVALRGDGTVVDWSGELLPFTAVTSVALGWEHVVALKSDGTVGAHGRDDDGQCDVPAGLTGVKAVAAGLGHSLALRHDGTVVAWGRNDQDQCRVPAGLAGVKAITAAWDYSVAIKEDESIVTWGRLSCGMDLPPVGLKGVKAVFTDGSCAIALLGEAATGIKTVSESSNPVFNVSSQEGRFVLSHPVPPGTMFTLVDLRGRTVMKAAVEGTQVRFPARIGSSVLLWKMQGARGCRKGRVVAK